MAAARPDISQLKVYLRLGTAWVSFLERTEIILPLPHGNCSEVWAERPGSSTAKAGQWWDPINSLTSSHNIAEVIINVAYFIISYISIIFIMLLLFLLSYIIVFIYFTVSVFIIVNCVLDFISLFVSWIFLYSIIFNISLLYIVYHTVWRLCISLARVHGLWKTCEVLSSTLLNQLCSIPHYFRG